MKIKELEDSIKEILGVDTECRFHPQRGWCLEVRTKKSYMFSEHMNQIGDISKKFGLDIYTSLKGFLSKKLVLYITEKGE